MEFSFLIHASKCAWPLTFACGSGLAQAQSTSTGETDERPIGLPSKIDWTFNFGTHWFEGSSFGDGMVYLAYAY